MSQVPDLAILAPNHVLFNFLMSYTPCSISVHLRKGATMPKGSHAERIKKRREEDPVALGGQGSSSGAAVDSGRVLRSKGQKRAALDDDIEEIDEERNESSDDDVEDEDFRVVPRHGKGPASSDSGDGDDGDGDEEEGNEEDDDDDGDAASNEIRMPKTQTPVRPSHLRMVNYYGSGKLETIKKKRKENPTTVAKTATDLRFHTLFQQDFYESVILAKPKIVSEAQWVDWGHLAKANDPIYMEIISTCERLKILDLMAFKHHWNKEIIAQFYATVYFGQRDGRRTMYWMTDGEQYHISFLQFAATLGFGKDVTRLTKLHLGGVLPTSEMAFMYPRNERANYGKVTGLYTYYAILNRMFRKTIAPRDGNPSDISLFARNLLARMRPGEEGFNVADYIWEEIKYISENPLKICGYGPYIMLLIEKVVGRKYPRDSRHEALRIHKTKHPRVPSPGRYDPIDEPMDDAPLQGDEPIGAPPHAPVEHEQHAHGGHEEQPQWQSRASSSHVHDKPPSPIRKVLGFLFCMCKTQRDVLVEQRRQRIAEKKERDANKRIYEHMQIQPPRSPISPEREEPEIPSVQTLVEQAQQGPEYTDFMASFPAMYYGGPSSSQPPPPPPPPGEGVFGVYTGASYFAHPAPPPPESSDALAAAAASALFGPSPAPYGGESRSVAAPDSIYLSTPTASFDDVTISSSIYLTTPWFDEKDPDGMDHSSED